MLSDRKLRILRCTTEALFSDAERTVPTDRLDWVDIEINDYLAATSGVTRTVVWFVLSILQFAPPLTGVRLARFTNCSVADRQRCLHRLERSPFFFSTLVAVLTKALLCTIYFEHPDALAETGFDGSCARSATTGSNGTP
jgi:hypothetical protein